MVDPPPARGRAPTGGAPVTWATPAEIPAVVLHRPHLVRTVGVALVVGTVLFLINQADVVLAGRATTATWVKSAVTYLVPFCVANYGLLTASRRRTTGPGGRAGAVADGGGVGGARR